jgi:hypothetical protein
MLVVVVTFVATFAALASRAGAGAETRVATCSCGAL